MSRQRGTRTIGRRAGLPISAIAQWPRNVRCASPGGRARACACPKVKSRRSTKLTAEARPGGGGGGAVKGCPGCLCVFERQAEGQCEYDCRIRYFYLCFLEKSRVEAGAAPRPLEGWRGGEGGTVCWAAAKQNTLALTGPYASTSSLLAALPPQPPPPPPPSPPSLFDLAAVHLPLFPQSTPGENRPARLPLPCRFVCIRCIKPGTRD